MSITLAILILADLIVDVAPWEKLWYLPFAAGFIVGYLLVGRQKYIIVANINVSSKHLILRHWVLYDHDGELCRQKQTNKDLFYRQFFGLHTRILDMNGEPPDITPDWVSNAKYPLFPKFVTSMLVLEDVEETREPVHIWWKINAKVTTTYIRVALASAASKLELLNSVDILTQQQDTISDLYGQIHQMQAAQGSKLMEMALRINNKACGASPENRMHSLLIREDGKMRDTKLADRKRELLKIVREGNVPEEEVLDDDEQA